MIWTFILQLNLSLCKRAGILHACLPWIPTLFPVRSNASFSRVAQLAALIRAGLSCHNSALSS